MASKSESDPWGESTQWSRILENPQGNETWEYLVRRYRGPVLASVLRRLPGHPHAEQWALDFFTYVDEQDVLARVDPAIGKFRAYLQGVLRRFLSRRLHELRHRGFQSIPEEAIVTETAAELEALDEAHWAARILRHACSTLVVQHPRNGALLLRFYGLNTYPRTPSEELRRENGLGESAFFKALHDGRNQLRALIREEVRQTVGTQQDFTEEWNLIRGRLCEAQGRLMQDLEGVEE